MRSVYLGQSLRTGNYVRCPFLFVHPFFLFSCPSSLSVIICPFFCLFLYVYPFVCPYVCCPFLFVCLCTSFYVRLIISFMSVCPFLYVHPFVRPYVRCPFPLCPSVNLFLFMSVCPSQSKVYEKKFSLVKKISLHATLSIVFSFPFVH